MNDKRPFAGLLWMCSACILFASMNIFARLASAQIPWAEVGAVRAAVAVALTLIIAKSRGVPFILRDQNKQKNAWARSIFGTSAMLCTFYALGAPAIALGDVVTLGSLSPVFIALLAPKLLGEPAGTWIWLATGLATLGVALVAGPTLHISGHLALVSVAGAFFSAMAMMYLRKLSGPSTGSSPGEARANPEAVVMHFSLFAMAVLLLIALPKLTIPTPRGALWLVATGISGGLAQLSMTRAYALEKAARLGILGYLTVVLSNLLGILVLRERPTLIQIAGTLLVVAAGVLPTLLSHPEEPRPAN